MDKQSAPEVRTVKEWHTALNDGDVDRLLSLSHPDVEVGGPRGAGNGSRILRDWANRAGIQLSPERFFLANETVIAEQEAAWASPDTGGATSSQLVASVFVVRDGFVASVIRYDSLNEALDSVGLNADEATEVG